jgi:cytidine deaminase
VKKKAASSRYLELMSAARAARARAYAPYSKYRVGAAVLSDDGRIFTGCNVENASYGLTQCAERVAITKAVSEGARRIKAVAVVVAGNDTASPCGACRQVIREFGPDAAVITGAPRGRVRVEHIEDLLPRAFSL